MPLLKLPTDVLHFELPPLLSSKEIQVLSTVCSNLRKLFLPQVFRRLDSDEHAFQKYLDLFRSHPSVLSQLRELRVVLSSQSILDSAREILELTGLRLEKAVLLECGRPNSVFFVQEAIELFPNIRYLHFHSSNFIDRPEENPTLARAVLKLRRLESLKASFMSDGTTFYETLLDEIATDRLKELVMDSISNSSKLLRLLSRQKCITNLNLVMKPFASRSGNDDNTALTEENLLAFSELRNLKTSLAGLLYVAPLLPLSLNLRHLALAEAEDPAHEHYWPKFNDILSSNLLDQINSFSIKTYLDESASHCIPNLFSLLGRLKSLQECTLHVGHVFNLTNPDANALNSILKSMKPSSSLRFLDINIMMSDDSFIHLAGFLSRCERLETFRLVVPENNLALRDDEHLKLFLSLLLSAPNLKSLHLPPLFSSNRLRFLTDTLASHPKKGLIEILLNPSLYYTLLDDLPGLLQLPNAPEIVKLCMREMRGDEGSIDRLIRLLDWVAGNIESLRLTQFLVKDLILVSADDVRRCFPALERLAYSSRLCVLQFYSCTLGVAEVELLERIVYGRKSKNLPELDFKFMFDDIELDLGTNVGFERLWRLRDGFGDLDFLDVQSRQAW